MRLLHPLAGGNVGTFVAHLRKHGSKAGRYWPRWLVSGAAVAARFPFYTAERWATAKRVAATDVREPIFIIGHWRSGTTHLHNVLSNDPAFGYVDFRHTALPLDILNPLDLGARVVKASLPEKRVIDEVRLGIETPQEEEMAIGNMNPVCYYNIYYFPHAWKQEYERSIRLDTLTDAERTRLREAYTTFLKRVTIDVGGKQLLLKNPPSTARIDFLKAWFPDAKFIEITRNPFEVFSSTYKHFGKIMPEFALQPWDHLDFTEMTLHNYRVLYETYQQTCHALEGSTYAKTSYEALTADPLGTTKSLYDALGLTLSPQAGEAITTYCASLQGYRRNTHVITSDQRDRIQASWGHIMERLGYSSDPPDSVEVATPD